MIIQNLKQRHFYISVMAVFPARQETIWIQIQWYLSQLVVMCFWSFSFIFVMFFIITFSSLHLHHEFVCESIYSYSRHCQIMCSDSNWNRTYALCSWSSLPMMKCMGCCQCTSATRCTSHNDSLLSQADCAVVMGEFHINLIAAIWITVSFFRFFFLK